MIKKMSVIVALCLFAIRAEQVLYLDQDLVEDAVAQILRSHGIQSNLRRHILESECVRRIVRSMVGRVDDQHDEDEPTLDFEEVA